MYHLVQGDSLQQDLQENIIVYRQVNFIPHCFLKDLLIPPRLFWAQWTDMRFILTAGAPPRMAGPPLDGRAHHDHGLLFIAVRLLAQSSIANTNGEYRTKTKIQVDSNSYHFYLHINLIYSNFQPSIRFKFGVQSRRFARILCEFRIGSEPRFDCLRQSAHLYTIDLNIFYKMVYTPTVVCVIKVHNQFVH